MAKNNVSSPCQTIAQQTFFKSWNNASACGCNEVHNFDFHYNNAYPLFLSDNRQNSDFLLAYNRLVGKKNKFGIGVYAKVQQEGVSTLNTLNLSSSHGINIGTGHHLRFGLSASYIYHLVDFENTRFIDQLDSTQGFIKTSDFNLKGDFHKSAFDMNFGLWYSHKSFSLGASFNHLAVPNISVYDYNELQFAYQVQAMYAITLGNNWNFNPIMRLYSAGNNSTPLLEGIAAVSHKDSWLMGIGISENYTSITSSFRLSSMLLWDISCHIPLSEYQQEFGILNQLETGLKIILQPKRTKEENK